MCIKVGNICKDLIRLVLSLFIYETLNIDYHLISIRNDNISIHFPRIIKIKRFNCTIINYSEYFPQKSALFTNNGYEDMTAPWMKSIRSTEMEDHIS